MSSSSQFRPPGPPSLDSQQYAADYEEVKQLGAAVGSTPVPNARAGIDHDGDLLGLEPRRADPQLPHPDGPVKRPPGVLPAWGATGSGSRWGAARALRRTLEDDIRSVALLLHAGREELEHPRQRDLGVVAGASRR